MAQSSNTQLPNRGSLRVRRQTQLGQTAPNDHNRRTTVINKVNPYLQARRRSNLEGYFASRSWGRCQAWKTEKLEFYPQVYRTTGKYTKEQHLKQSYPLTHNGYSYYCPSCDVYFRDYDEYQDHLIIQGFMMPYINIIEECSKAPPLADRNESVMFGSKLLDSKDNKLDPQASGSTQRKQRKSLVESNIPKTYTISETKRYYDAETMIKELKVKRAKALKMRRKLKLQPMRMSKRQNRRLTLIGSSTTAEIENRSSCTQGRMSMNRTSVKRHERMSLQRQESDIAPMTSTMTGVPNRMTRNSVTAGPRNTRLSLLTAMRQKDLKKD